MTSTAFRPDTEDGTLARAHLAGDRDAFAALYRRHHPNLVDWLTTRTRDRARSEDLAQEALVRALRSLACYDPSRAFWPWVRTIAFHLMANDAQKRSAELPVDDVAAVGEPAGADDAERVVTRDALVRALRELPARQRRALVMRYLEDRPPDEAAAAFGLTRPAFDQLLWRARQSLSKAYRAPALAALPLAGRLRRLLTA
ncbi:MAG TPA: sigma-70 family RNA polymerase sigma factor, partial [Mycobacteriales bacterium]|nr:sigma-70 family RNA polymerase sigma factor [Mycobacteriales bacterium]